MCYRGGRGHGGDGCVLATSEAGNHSNVWCA